MNRFEIFKDLNIVFGTDNEPFILKINRKTSEFFIEPIIWDLRLKNH